MRKYFFILFLLVNCGHLFSQPSSLYTKDIIFEHPGEEFGLSQQSINCMIQDKDGFLWLGTWTGLLLYDGYSTTVFQSDNSSPGALKSNKIIALFEDEDGIVWIGTMMSGLYKYDKLTNTFTNYAFNPDDNTSLSNNNIWSIVADNTGKLWVGTENGLNHFDPKTGTSVRYYADPQNESSLSFNFITSLYLDHQNHLWIGTEQGMNQLNLSSPERNFVQHPYARDAESRELHNYVYTITSYFTSDSTEVICWSTKKGFKMLFGDTIKNFQHEDRPLSFSFFRKIYSYDHENKYLLLGSEMGLSIFDIQQMKFTKFFGNFDKTVNLSHNTVTSIFIDKTGVLWVGTKKGINKFDTYNKNFDLYLTDSFDPTKSIITGLAHTPSGQFWISTIGGGIYLFDKYKRLKEGPDETFTKYKLQTKEEDDFSDFVQTLYADKAGNIWVGTAGAGVFSFHEKAVPYRTSTIATYKNYNASEDGKNQLSDNYIMALAESRDGGIWVGTWSGGINKILPQGGVIHYIQKEFTEAPVVDLYEDDSGTLWVGTRGSGLLKATFSDTYVIDLQIYRYSDRPGSISNDFINTIYEDHKGRIWVGTERGLNCFNRQNNLFDLVKVKGSESAEVVVGILEDDMGKLWYSHWNGITVFDPNDTVNSVVNDYDRRDRIQGGFFYNSVCLKDPSGNLFFGGANGFNIIYPDLVNQNPFKPDVELRDFSIFNKPVGVNEEFNGRVILGQPLSETGQIFLNYDENSLALEFAALHFSVPEKNKYAYRLKGFEDKWKYTDASRRYANYTNLPDGDYVFEVKASNNDGVWSDDVQQLKIRINPPWYKTWYAKLGYAALVILILYLYRRFNIIRSNYISNIRIERINRENIEKLNKAKLQFFTNVSHEFRTPLTLILGPLEKIINSGEGGKAFRDQLGIINRNAQRLLRLVNQLLDFRKAEAGKLKLRVAEGNIVKFLKEVKLSFEALAEQKNIQFVFRTSSDTIKVWYDRDQFEKIFFNLLSNAFNHTSDGGQIIIDVTEQKDNVVVTVEDNGTGIKPENFKKIFRRFYSEEDALHNGTGIGLALTKSLIELHEGSIAVESTENEFSRFTVTVPLGNAHFKDSEIVKDFKDSEDINNYYQVNKEFQMPQKMADAENVDLRKLKKILIVEDNTEVRAYIKSIFCGQYRLFEAENGEEGVELAEKYNPDVVISDVMMPGMNGIQFCRHIKQNIKTSHIPIILLTARTSLIFRLEGLENGADDYITKPFNAQVLTLKVKNLLKSREQLKKLFRDNDVLEIEPKKVTLSSADEEFVQKALESIEKNMSNSEFSVEEFGRDLGMSRMNLYRKLKALTGQSANEFIRSIRLKRAAQLLEQNQLTVAEVTYEVGFTDLQYFRNCFKKQFNVNPSEYAKVDDQATLDDSEIPKSDIYPS